VGGRGRCLTVVDSRGEGSTARLERQAAGTPGWEGIGSATRVRGADPATPPSDGRERGRTDARNP